MTAKIFLNYFLNVRTSQISKVPSFGASNQTSNRQEVNGSSSANKAEGTQTDDVGSSRSSASEEEEVSMDCGDITDQDRVQAADEQENQEEEEDPGAANVEMTQDANTVEHSVDAEPSHQVRSKRDDTAMIKSDIPAG